MSLKLSGNQRERLVDAICEAFPTNDGLAQMMSFKLNKNVQNFDGNNLRARVTSIVQDAEAKNWLRNLLDAAIESNPTNESLREILLDSAQVSVNGYSISLEVTKPGVLRYFFDQYFPSFHRFLTKQGSFPEPEETIALNNYLRELTAKLKHEINQKTTYIPLSGKEVPQTIFQSQKDKDPFIQPIHQVIRQIMGQNRGGDSASAQIAAVSQKSRVINNIIKTLLETDDPMILLGDPGTGKTMSLQQATLLLANRQINRVFPIVTVFVRLNEFYIEGKVKTDDVLNYVKKSVPAEIRPYLDGLDDAGDRLIILFDGMDEMSRARYNEYTEALSEFAESRRGKTKTLFSCRITDFSPRFIHQRLVLLPFNQNQISEYLKKYIQDFPIRVEGESLTLKKLTKKLVNGDLPLEINNPFVLWLLCFQLQENGLIPKSRVELLRFYIEQNYQRKIVDLSEEEKIGIDVLLQRWGHFAYAITDLNRGAAIEINALCRETGHKIEDVDAAIKLGELCGVLKETVKEGERLIKFEHHRFQEFFTAYYINEVKPEISWLDKLDAPRWQETMLNLISMDDDNNVLQVLCDSINDDISLFRLRRYVKDSASFREWYESPISQTWRETSLSDTLKNIPVEEMEKHLENPLTETTIADRIELSSRILRQSGEKDSPTNQILMPAFSSATKDLAENGNPITQVKMMRACQNVPSLDFIEILEDALNSPINWVRTQALIIASSGGVKGQNVGSHFATRLGYDLADGSFPTKISTYAKAAFNSRSKKNWWSFIVGSFSYLLNAAVLLAISCVLFVLGAGFRAVQENQIPLLQQDFYNVLAETPLLYIIIYAAIVLGAFIISLKYEPNAIGLAILGSSTVILFILPIINFAWEGAFLKIVGAFFFFLLIGYLLTLIVAASHYFFLVLYLTATAPLRSSNHPIKSFLSAAWTNSWYEEVIGESLGCVGVFIGIIVVISLSPAIFGFLKGVGAMIPLPYSPVINILILALFLLLVGIGIMILAGKRKWVIEAFGVVILGGLGLLLYGIGGILLSLVVGWIYSLLKDASSFALYGSLLLVGILLLALLAACGYGLWLLYCMAKVYVGRVIPGTLKFRSVEGWKTSLMSDPEKQANILNNTTHLTLRIRADEFLEAMKDVEDLIKEEPALSTYWDKRDQLEQVLRHERQG